MKILASNSNDRGDLFARLAADLFSAQGYDEPSVNVSKSGREIDLRASHRLEPKVVIAECKATEKPIGGDALNKFAGVLQIESDQEDHSQVQGYFVSLNGFTETALVQEEEAKTQRFVLLSGDDVQAQLVAGKMVVSRKRAIEAATRLIGSEADLRLIGDPELLAHRLGWIWLCVYGRHHESSHFALIHADGQPLGAQLAEQVIASDTEVGGDLRELSYLAPSAAEGAALAEADQAYRDYLVAELGQITLEGMPADEEVGARRIALEDLYVPLRVDQPEVSVAGAAAGEADDPSLAGEEVDDTVPAESEPGEPIGAALASHSRLAVLAAPGAGKSTLIKRLAVAYAARAHLELIDDELPDEDWFPIFLRCRALGGDVNKPVHELISEIPVRGEFPDLRLSFAELASQALLAGRALLLIDGLDEITEQSDRLRFVLQLRTFLATYPNARLVLTSRPAGFRIVAGAMSSLCTQRRLAEFSNQDIGSLTRAWHATVVGESAEVDAEAQDLAETIIANDRVRRLARNPLLLTTLLLVKRWVGDLPRKRTILYEKAIEVLLMTWNVEAHEPIDRDEAIPQLAYVAHALTREGEQSVSSLQLTKLLDQAREQMPEVLGFARTTTSSFIEEIENRSSLLVMTGHVVDRGQLVPNYEFRHLTFQEYLAAVALVEGYYEGHEDEDRLVDQFAPYWADPQWSEVIALGLVIAGRSAGSVVEGMSKFVDQFGGEARHRVLDLLAGALADEVQLPPDRVREMSLLLGQDRTLRRKAFLPEILEGRYGEAVVSTIEQRYFDDSTVDFPDYAAAFETVTEARLGTLELRSAKDRGTLISLLESGEDESVARGAVLTMLAAYGALMRKGPPWTDEANLISRLLIEACDGARPYVSYMAAWALAWLGEMGAVDIRDRGRALRVLLEVWRHSRSLSLRQVGAWAFSAIPTVPRGDEPLGQPTADLTAFLEGEFDAEVSTGRREDRRPAALMLAYYLGAPWSDQELRDRTESLRPNRLENLRTIGRLFPPPATERPGKVVGRAT